MNQEITCPIDGHICSLNKCSTKSRYIEDVINAISVRNIGVTAAKLLNNSQVKKEAKEGLVTNLAQISEKYGIEPMKLVDYAKNIIERD